MANDDIHNAIVRISNVLDTMHRKTYFNTTFCI